MSSKLSRKGNGGTGVSAEWAIHNSRYYDSGPLIQLIKGRYSIS